MRIKQLMSLVLILCLYVVSMVGCQPAIPQPQFSTSFETDMTPIPLPSKDSELVTLLTGRIRSFDVSSDEKTIAIATSEGIILYDLASGKLLRTLAEAENGFSVAWSPDGSMLATGSLIMETSEIGKAHLAVWNTSTWKVVFEPETSSDTFTIFGAFAWSHKGNLLAASDNDRGLIVYNIKTGKTFAFQKEFLLSPYNLSWSPDDSRIVVTGDLGYGFRRWLVGTDKSVRLYDKRVAAFATQLEWSADGNRIASIHADGAVCLWTTATNLCDGYIKAHHNFGFALAWSPVGNQLATSGSIIRIWDAQNGNPIKSFGLSDESVYTQLQWLTDGKLISLETGYADKASTIIRFWDMDTGTVLFEFHGAEGTFGE